VIVGIAAQFEIAISLEQFECGLLERVTDWGEHS
jgi:hypothetical protein